MKGGRFRQRAREVVNGVTEFDWDGDTFEKNHNYKILNDISIKIAGLLANNT